ncbi:hypothetical protein Sjap_009634 [Stephania japonica]|uniref:Uncharacterized protein n=1 Tax=Stephania japonica TaxID=461633 RepID=A0AAP0J7G6_9MAGN
MRGGGHGGVGPIGQEVMVIGDSDDGGVVGQLRGMERGDNRGGEVDNGGVVVFGGSEPMAKTVLVRVAVV